MDKNLSNFPLLFEQIGAFLTHFADLREKRLELSSEAFVVEFDKLIKSNNPSEADAAIAAFNEISNTIYMRTFVGGCSGGGTRQR